MTVVGFLSFPSQVANKSGVCDESRSILDVIFDEDVFHN